MKESAAAEHEATLDWQLRARGVSASEVATLMGANPYGSIGELWESKVNPKPRGNDLAGNLDVERGIELEGSIIRWSAKKIGSDYQIVKTQQSTEFALCLATPDALLIAPNSLCDVPVPWAVLEVKSPSSRTAHAWHAPDDHGAGGSYPAHYGLQVQWQMLATGLRVGFLAALIGDYLQIHRIERDDAMLENMKSRVLDFWGYVSRREVPPLSMPGDLAWARVTWPEQRTEEVVDLTGNAEVEDLLSRLAANQAAENVICDNIDAAKARLAQLIGTARGLRCAVWLVSFAQNKASSKLDVDKLIEVTGATAHQIEAATVSKPGARVMRIKKDIEK